VPDGTPVADNDVTRVPVDALRRSARPDADPISSRYDAGAPPVVGAFQDSVIEEPAEDATRFVGGPGSVSADAPWARVDIGPHRAIATRIDAAIVCLTNRLMNVSPL
jgi:hypothetical protein